MGNRSTTIPPTWPTLSGRWQRRTLPACSSSRTLTCPAFQTTTRHVGGRGCGRSRLEDDFMKEAFCYLCRSWQFVDRGRFRDHEVGTIIRRDGESRESAIERAKAAATRCPNSGKKPGLDIS